MGLFSWLFGKPSRVKSQDVIWLTGEARLNGAVRATNRHIAANRSVLVLAHFPASLTVFGEQIIGRETPHATIPTTLTAAAALELANGPPRVLLGLVRNLQPDEFPAPDSAPESPLPVLVLERHFLRKHDDHVVRFAEGLGSKASVDFYISLDDPLLSIFVGDWVKEMLRKLGMQPDETINSPMVSRRIEQAQAKIERETSSDVEAESASDWHERNRGR
ncbi:MAG: hypothetical protein U0792_03960 [Gemmataceae bacterium]